MSNELLLFVAFLIVVPLLEYVVRLLRGDGEPRQRPESPPGQIRRGPGPARRPRPPAQTAPKPTAGRPTSAPIPTVPPPAPPVPTGQLQAPLPVTLEGVSLEDIRPEIGKVAAAGRALSERMPLQRKPRSIVGSPEDLRRAVVLAAILGPCRAVQDPEDSPAFSR
jgi:hypothetical protein